MMEFVSDFISDQDRAAIIKLSVWVAADVTQ